MYITFPGTLAFVCFRQTVKYQDMRLVTKIQRDNIPRDKLNDWKGNVASRGCFFQEAKMGQGTKSIQDGWSHSGSALARIMVTMFSNHGKVFHGSKGSNVHDLPGDTCLWLLPQCASSCGSPNDDAEGVVAAIGQLFLVVGGNGHQPFDCL